ncbi:MAG: SDR family NAD(P)-dependent oxidoreductase [Deltaproteobacteria bacterium]|nr:SDR family NAD(P)-dependent oxidoreductase [Deltaproteobacteria bacterium]
MSKSTTDSGATGVGHHNAFSATLTGILDRFSSTGKIEGPGEDDRLDGRSCLITGASSGLGKALAVELARRGAHVLMACRSGIPEAGEDVKRASGSQNVEMLPVDLADLDCVHGLADALRESGRKLDVVVLNAGLMPAKAYRTKQGFEVMFGVHFLANRLLIDRLLEDGVIVPRGAREGVSAPRIVFVSSESHRSASPIDFDRFGEFVDYGIRDGMAQYGRSKLHMCTLACELSRRLNPDDEVRVSVHALCPGPINSNITRDAPGLLKPVLDVVLGLAFQSPAKAAAPVVHLACSRSIEGETGLYLHMLRRKDPSPEAMDPRKGALLWEKSRKLLDAHPPRA